MIKILLDNQEWELLKALIPKVPLFDSLREKIVHPADQVIVDMKLLEEAYNNGYFNGKEDYIQGCFNAPFNPPVYNEE